MCTSFRNLMQAFREIKGFYTALPRQIDELGDYASLMGNKLLSKMCFKSHSTIAQNTK